MIKRVTVTAAYIGYMDVEVPEHADPIQVANLLLKTGYHVDLSFSGFTKLEEDTDFEGEDE